MPRVIIVGGGISGLSTAYYLAKGGVPSTILESRPRLGGVIQTERVEGCTIEGGPDSFLSVKPAALELIRELGLADQVIGSNDHLRVTYIRKRGRLLPMPDGLMLMVPTKILPLLGTRLLSTRTKLRMGFELLRHPAPKPGDESVGEFIEEHYGREAVDYLAEPLLSGIYGGNPDELSVGSVLGRFVELSNRYGSLTRGVLAERAKAPRRHGPPPPLFQTLRGGLGQMVDAISAAIHEATLVRRVRAEAAERAGSGFRIRAGGDWLEADRVVLACEAHSASALLAGLDPRAAELLGAVPYTSSMTVALGFNAADVRQPPDGFGFLVPKKERQSLVACTWIGTKFPYRVPEGKIVARCFFSSGEEESAATASAERELLEIAGIRAQPVFARAFGWPRSMAQYTVGHAARVAEVQARAAAIAGLYLAGNAYEGIGVPDCIRLGRRAAEAILSSRPA